MRGYRILVRVIAVLALVSISAFLYLTRDIAPPSQPIAANITPVASNSQDSALTVFSIVQAGSQAEYNIYELLEGQDKTVVGVTDQVGGEIALNLADLAQSQIGEIRINARTFATDSGRRDNAVARFVLQSEDAGNEFIVFQPTQISGLSGSAAIGASVTFQVAGDLTIAGVTQSITFDVTATLDSAEQFSGSAQTTISRAAFNLNVPSVPFVASVADDVTLRLTFVAAAS
jgi:polyisoprenoid-binding protein YceI